MKWWILLLSILYYETIYTQTLQSIDTSYANQYYQEKVLEFQNEEIDSGAIVFIGNSITEVGPWETVKAHYPIVNRGISGDNTFGVYYRLQQIVDLNPSRIFIMIGVNDVKRGTSPENIIRNHNRIIEFLQQQAPKSNIFLQSILPVNEEMLANIYNRINNKIINELNKELEKIAKFYNVAYLDLNQHFLRKNDQLPETYTTDGLHLSAQGYARWIDFLSDNGYLYK